MSCYRFNLGANELHKTKYFDADARLFTYEKQF
jgi:hypothetical protein